ncbi:acyltransferase [Vibrio rumoiensis]|uniref:Acyltransferase 3 domain-containing protein n=1 Tax=Vibrio rumoiensis 1S-45 TaxID=1188252 RepID=A0A1E5E353_9VIBR|nr:acyltransferase [Vibrio rumoiensis]OEF26109.1 hypothetical protein A1QC_07500 [Vibrio rumoiensis 1S-45]
MNQRVFFFDLLRCVAAVAVIAIHVLAPYRHELGVISFSDWATAVSVNGVSRWAVPVFIMISGALLLTDTRPFNFKYYVQRRLGKVLVPFVVWSLFYVYLSGWTATGFDVSVSQQVLRDSLTHETYYHLGFFYYFIPLYLLIPFFQIFVRYVDDTTLFATVGLWLLCTTMFLFSIDGPWSNQYFLYSGYLLLGYVLYQKIPLTSAAVSAIALLGIVALIATVGMVIYGSLEAGEYTVGRWLSYKTLNTVLAASMVFMVCRFYGERLSGKARKVVGFVSTYSLGIYILHPIFLWPMKNFGWYQGHSAWVIPLWIVLSGAGSLGLSWLIARSAKTRWLLP